MSGFSKTAMREIPEPKSSNELGWVEISQNVDFVLEISRYFGLIIKFNFAPYFCLEDDQYQYTFSSGKISLTSG